MRLKGHLLDVKHRPDLNKHKTSWILLLLELNLQPIIKLVPKFIYYSKELLESEYINYKKNSFTRKSYIKVGLYDLNNNLIKVFNTLSEAGKSLGIKSARGYIKQCCEDKIKTYHNFIWKFA